MRSASASGSLPRSVLVPLAAVRGVAAVAGLSAFGCGGESPPVLLGPPPALLGASFDDGAPVSPTAALTLDFSLPLDEEGADERAFVLVRGVLTDDERRDLSGGEPGASLRDRTAPLRVERAGTRVTLRPRRPLAGSARHTLFVTTALRAGGRRLLSPIERGLRTRAESEGAPWLELVDPRPDAPGVVRNLRAVRVLANRAVVGAGGDGVRLVDEEPGGEVVAARVAEEPAEGEEEPGRRFRVELSAPLRALHRYRVELAPSVRALDGTAPFSPDPAPGVRAGLELRSEAPALSALELSSSSGCLVARFLSDRPASASLCVEAASGLRCAALADRRVVHQLELPGRFERATARIAARDESSAPEAVAGPLPLPSSSPRTLIITEVLSRPLDGRLASQYVELMNVGEAPERTDGLSLWDERGGSPLPDAVLAPGALALVVPLDYPEVGDDPRPLPGTALLRVGDKHLGGNGVRQSGEALELRDGGGRPVSRFSTVGLKLLAGQSARRAAPCDRDGAYEGTPRGTATPGGP